MNKKLVKNLKTRMYLLMMMMKKKAIRWSERIVAEDLVE